MEVKQLRVAFTCTNDGVLKGNIIGNGEYDQDENYDNAKDNKHGAIGDWVYASSLPENFYKITGQKIIDLNKTWVFDHNPYVDRDVEPDKIIDIKPAWFHYNRDVPVMYSFADSLMAFLGTDQLPYCRHPRFYRYEDEDIIPNRLILHVEGNHDKPTPRIMSDEVIQFVLDKYKMYDIIQIGGNSDKKIEGVIDERGIDLWDVVKLMSSAAIFVGVDSGPYHIAQAYPRINRKLIVTKDQFKSDWPADFYILNPKQDVSYWYDWDTMFYNEFDRDAGLTTSYLKI